MPRKTLKVNRLYILMACLLGAASAVACDDTPDDTQSLAAGDATGDTGDAAPPPSVVDLRMDANRDGIASLSDPEDERDEATWSPTHGAIVLANIDDDEWRCPTSTSDGAPLPDQTLAACNDAQDDTVNGPEDAKDLAPLVLAPWPDAPADARATLKVYPSDKGRLFRQQPSGDWLLITDTDILTPDDLRAGLTLALEATTLITDTNDWTGTISVAIELEAQFSPDGTPAITDRDQVQAKVAPMILHHHLEPATQLWASDATTGGFSGDPIEQRIIDTSTESVLQFQADLRDAVAAAVPGVELTLLSAAPFYEDPWTQDLFETAWAAMPGPDGQPHLMTLVLRSASENRDISPFDPNIKDYPLRMAARVVFEQLRGPNVGGVQVYDPRAPSDLDTLDSFGNMETIPPHTDPSTGQTHPHGRVLIGNVSSYASDPKVRRFLESQGAQSPLYVDTSWLLVGHVDEFLSFLPANNARGWVLLKFDASLAIEMLEQARDAGHGDVIVFEGFSRFTYPEDRGQSYAEVAADVTINGLLEDPDIMAASAAAAAEANTQAQRVIDAAGLTPDDIIRVPFLMEEIYGQHIAFGPGTVNGVLLAPGHFASPKPHGPIIDGQDLWASYLEAALAPHNTTIHWVEDWYSYHINFGEVHCGTNTLRQTPADKAAWWQLAQPSE